jgi:hypothetical protein
MPSTGVVRSSKEMGLERILENDAEECILFFIQTVRRRRLHSLAHNDKDSFWTIRLY